MTIQKNNSIIFLSAHSFKSNVEVERKFFTLLRPIECEKRWKIQYSDFQDFAN